MTGPMFPEVDGWIHLAADDPTATTPAGLLLQEHIVPAARAR